MLKVSSIPTIASKTPETAFLGFKICHCPPPPQAYKAMYGSSTSRDQRIGKLPKKHGDATLSNQYKGFLHYAVAFCGKFNAQIRCPTSFRLI